MNEGKNEFPIVEPLSEATKQTLKPLKLENRDALLIGTTEDGEHFTVEIIACDVVPFGPLTERMQERVLSGARRYTTATKIYIIQNPHYAVGWNARKWVRSLVETKFLTREKWMTAATDYIALMIHHCWPKKRLIFLDETAELLYCFLLKRFFSQSVRANLQAEFKLNEVVPEMPKDYIRHEKLPLSDYQEVALMMSLGQEATGLFMEQGTGKTPICIARVCLEAERHYKKTGKMLRVLIVVPRQVRGNWSNEFERFATVAGKITVIRGSKLKRTRLLTYAMKEEEDCFFSAIVASYDSVASDVEILEKVMWDLIICDESHKFKSSKTHRFKSLRRLRDRSKRRCILTGTPIGNTMMDLWAQFEFLGKGLSGFQAFDNFKKFHGKYETSYTGKETSVQKLSGVTNIPLIQERLSRITFSITKKEAKLNLPDKVYDTWEVDLTPQQTLYYRKLRDDLIIQLQSEKITADHILTKLLRLAQVCSGHIKIDNILDPETKVLLRRGNVRQIPGGNPKIDAVVEMLRDPERDPREKKVIWCCFREDIRAICERLDTESIVCGHYYGSTSDKMREENLYRFNNDSEFRVLVANPASAGEGLNLLGYDPHRNGDLDNEGYCGHEIFFSQDWSYIHRVQAEARAHRRGTRYPVRITDLVVPTVDDDTSVDQKIRDRVSGKKAHAASIQDISSILQDVLGMDLRSLMR